MGDLAVNDASMGNAGDCDSHNVILDRVKDAVIAHTYAILVGAFQPFAISWARVVSERTNACRNAFANLEGEFFDFALSR